MPPNTNAAQLALANQPGSVLQSAPNGPATGLSPQDEAALAVYLSTKEGGGASSGLASGIAKNVAQNPQNNPYMKFMGKAREHTAMLQAQEQQGHGALMQYFVNQGIHPTVAAILAAKVGSMSPPPAPLANGVQPGPVGVSEPLTLHDPVSGQPYVPSQSTPGGQRKETLINTGNMMGPGSPIPSPAETQSGVDKAMNTYLNSRYGMDRKGYKGSTIKETPSRSFMDREASDTPEK